MAGNPCLDSLCSLIARLLSSLNHFRFEDFLTPKANESGQDADFSVSPLMTQSGHLRALLDSLNIREVSGLTTALRYVFVLVN